ncbi:MAG: C25 family cysteine peptidase [Candidatus Hatepunaea meridiana]|nr:C25 family cysteine peptidase [Candidatus Hatepunaea meridiana]
MCRILCSAFFLLLFITNSVVASINPLTARNEHAQIIASDNQTVSLSFELTGVEKRTVTKDDLTFEVYGIPGEGVILEYNKPILPSISRFIVIPPDVNVELVVMTGEPRVEQLNHPPAVSDDENVSYNGTNTVAGQTFLSVINNELYPPEPAIVSEPVVIRGVRLVMVTTYPIQYDPSTNSYIHHEYIETELRFIQGDPINPVNSPIRRNRSANFLKYIKALAINGDVVGRDDPDQDTEPPYIGHYLIATHESCLQFAAPFIEWRRKSGYKVDILRLTSGQAGNSSNVKSAIQARYDAYLDDEIDPFDEILLIGDRAHYYYSTAANWILLPFRGEPTWGNDSHADYLFACLEGGNNDRHPDAGISRWHSGNSNLMQLAVGRTLAYEAEPYMEETDWFTRGGVYSQHWGNTNTSAWHISIHTNVPWAYEVLEHLGFDDVGFYEDFNWDQGGARIGPVIARWLNEGLNLLVGRAENYYWRQNFNGVNRNVVFPINLCASGHGEWCAESMTRTGSGNDLKGPVAMTYGWGNPPYTAPISACWMECVNAVLQLDMSLGWGRVYGITSTETYFGGGQNYILSNKTEFDCFGDPGIQPWIGVPTVVEAEFSESITPNTKMIEVHVTDEESGDDVPDAQVTLYSPGDMPNFNSADYANHDEMVMITKKSDSDGKARFIFDEPVFDHRYDLFLTITGRNICPLFEEIDVESNLDAIDIAEYTLSEIEGNDDDEINPDEEFSLELTAVNMSRGDNMRDVTAVVSSPSPWVEVEDGELSFGNIDACDEAEADEAVTLIISPTCPDGESRPATRPVILVEFSSGNDTWSSSIKLDPHAPHFEVHSIVGGEIIPVDVHNLNVEIRNSGRMTARGITARLSSRGMGVSIMNNSARYPDIDAGRHQRISGDPFTVSGNSIVPPGFRSNVMMILNSNNSFIDTTYFELQVNEPRANAPSPPDNYGYMCFDNTDNGWDISPEYEWIEISTRADEWDYRGERIDFDGEAPHNIGWAEVIELGFTSKLYGCEFDEITISTNGFISIGDQELIENHQNWPLDRATGGGAGMIAPFWDDLRMTGNDAGVYYFYDEENDRMIVEWYKLRHATGGNTDLIFEVVIHDADVWVVDENRNPFIVFQYKSIANVQNIRQGDQAWAKNIPFASVGISSPDGNSGINYTFNNQYPVWAARLENRLALLFTTTPRFKSGCIEGWVTDAENGQPLPEALVYTEHGFVSECDEDGRFFIQDALAEIEFSITASCPGYNDSTYIDTMLIENDTLEIIFGLLHPEFDPSDVELSAYIDPDWSIDIPFNIHNTGNGPLDWSLSRLLPGGAERDPWEQRLSYFVGDTVNDSRIEGVIYIDGLFYVSGANRQGREDGPNMIYVLERNINDDGEEVINEINRYEQCGNSNYGFRDMAYDGELIWASGERNVYGFFLDNGEVADSIEGPFSSQQALTWDSDRDILWMSGITSQYIAGYDQQGEEIERLARNGLRIYGLAYWHDDPDNHPLYIFNGPGDGRQVVHKINPDDGDTMFVRELRPVGGGTPNGAFATNQFDVYSWVFITISNDGADDRIDVWQLDARRDWFRVFTGEQEEREEVSLGRIEADEVLDFDLQLSSIDLPILQTFEAMLHFYHNAEGGETVIDVTLEVIGPMLPSEFGLLSPDDNDTLDANIDTTITTFNWEPSTDYNHEDIITYLVWFESDNDTAMVRVDTDSLTINIADLADNLELSIEVEFPLFWWVQAVSGADTADCYRRFSFTFMPNKVIGSDEGIPVEFGLQSIYPSPFNSMTTVRFGMDSPDRVRLNVFDLMGRRIAMLFDSKNAVGYHNVVWNASALPSGLYIVQLVTVGRMQTMKVALVK